MLRERVPADQLMKFPDQQEPWGEGHLSFQLHVQWRCIGGLWLAMVGAFTPW